jgi:flagellar assembly factor FliW
MHVFSSAGASAATEESLCALSASAVKKKGMNVLKLETRDFGPVEIDDRKVITMPSGMPGFPGMQHFVILEREGTRPFLWYQSVEDPQLAFALINPYLFKPDYEVNLAPAAKDMSWEESRKEDLAVYVIVNASEGVPEKITANLIGPLVINTGKNEAVQMVISGSPYSHKQPIFPSS